MCFAGVSGTLRPRWLQRRKGGPIIRMDMVNQSVYLSLLCCFGYFFVFTNFTQQKSRIINFHVYGNDGRWTSAKSKFYILRKCQICLARCIMLLLKITFARTPNHSVRKRQVLFCAVSLPVSGEETRRESLCERQLAASRLATCSAVCIQHAQRPAVRIISHVFLCLCIFEFWTGMTVPTTSCYKMQKHWLAIVTNATKKRSSKCGIYTTVSGIKTSDKSAEQKSFNYHAPSSFCLSFLPLPPRL